MNILICNDDGIHAPGIVALHEAASAFGAVNVVAPEAERSAVGHAITIYNPLKTKIVNRNAAFFGYAVDGTPADCVKLAVRALLPQPPDLVLSGINLGPNAGVSIIYSGTVSAATEGLILGIPSVAFSLCTFKEPDWECAKQVVRDVMEMIKRAPLPPGVLLNVNIPNMPYESIKGRKITRMASSRYEETFEQRVDPRGNHYYWMDGDLSALGDPKDTDLQALHDGYVSLSPLHFDLTRHEALAALEEWNHWSDVSDSGA
jgi:5'-nucleotidase